MCNKLMEIEKAIGGIRDGMSVMIGRFGVPGTRACPGRCQPSTASAPPASRPNGTCHAGAVQQQPGRIVRGRMDHSPRRIST